MLHVILMGINNAFTFNEAKLELCLDPWIPQCVYIYSVALRSLMCAGQIFSLIFKSKSLFLNLMVAMSTCPTWVDDATTKDVQADQ